MGQTELEAALAFQIRALKLPAPVTEHRFHPTRKWRFDFAWPELMVACEVEGGTWMRPVADEGWGRARGGGHGQPIQFEEDAEKYNEAIVLGWSVVRVTTKMIDDGRAVNIVERVLGRARQEMAG